MLVADDAGDAAAWETLGQSYQHFHRILISTSDPVELHPRHLDLSMQVCLPVYSLSTVANIGALSSWRLHLWHWDWHQHCSILDYKKRKMTWGSGNFLAVLRKDALLLPPLCCEGSLATWSELLPCFKDTLWWPALSPAPPRAACARGQALAMQGCRQSTKRLNVLLLAQEELVHRAGWWGCPAPFATTRTGKAGEGQILLQWAVLDSTPVLKAFPIKVCWANSRGVSHQEENLSWCSGWPAHGAGLVFAFPLGFHDVILPLLAFTHSRVCLWPREERAIFYF